MYSICVIVSLVTESSPLLTSRSRRSINIKSQRDIRNEWKWTRCCMFVALWCGDRCETRSRGRSSNQASIAPPSSIIIAHSSAREPIVSADSLGGRRSSPLDSLRTNPSRPLKSIRSIRNSLDSVALNKLSDSYTRSICKYNAQYMKSLYLTYSFCIKKFISRYIAYWDLFHKDKDFQELDINE